MTALFSKTFKRGKSAIEANRTDLILGLHSAKRHKILKSKVARPAKFLSSLGEGTT